MSVSYSLNLYFSDTLNFDAAKPLDLDPAHIVTCQLYKEVPDGASSLIYSLAYLLVEKIQCTA